MKKSLVVSAILPVAILTLAGCGSSKPVHTQATAAQFPTSTTTPAPVTTSLTGNPSTVVELSGAAISDKVTAFYKTYANDWDNFGSSGQSQQTFDTQISNLEQQYMDSSLQAQINSEKPHLDYDPIECGQNSSPLVNVNVTRISGGTYDAIVTTTFTGPPQSSTKIKVSGAGDTALIHSIQC